MTPRERLLCALNHKRADRVPFEFDFTPPLYEVFKEKTGLEDYAEYFDMDVRRVYLNPTRMKRDFSKYFEYLPKDVYFDEWGIGHVSSGFYHLEGMVHPLSNKPLAVLENYLFPDLDADYRYEGLDKKIEELHKRGYAVSFWGVTSIFEPAWYLRGMENLLIDMLEDNEFVSILLDKITEIAISSNKKAVQLDPDVIILGDDVGSQKGMLISPSLWRRYLKPGLSRLIKVIKDTNSKVFIYYHSDGDIRKIIPDLIEIGVEILNPVQPECMDPEEIKELYGDKISLWGTIGTQTTMPFGTLEEVKRVVRERVDKLGKNGGLVLAPTHVLEPDVPWENILAFVEAVKESV
jgi:uroporphyrinogen decarboxylase